MAEITWTDRLRYRFDRMLARGSAAGILWVLAITVLLAVVGGIVFWLLGLEFGKRSGLSESMWRSFLISIGKGGIVDGDWTHRVVTLVFLFAGIFLAGSLIGLLVAAVTRRMELLRRGRSRVLEQGHTVILGWSPRLMAVIEELLAESSDMRGPAVVVLADRDKTAMEDDFLARHRGPERRRVIFRSGRPTAQADLELVAIDRARSIIVLNGGSFVDARAVRTALTAQAYEADEAHVVTEVTNPRVARSLTESTDGSVATVCVTEVVADMLAQAIRTPGMAHVFDELLAFEGDELYLHPAPTRLVGRRCSDLIKVAGATVIGIADEDSVVLAPPADRIVAATDRLVSLAPSYDALSGLEIGPAFPMIGKVGPLGTLPVKAVVLGWNAVGVRLLDRCAGFFPPGSEMRVLADQSMLPGGFPEWTWDVNGGFWHTKHDPDEVIGTIQEMGADVVVVLAYGDQMSNDESDALTMLTLLTLERARAAGSIGDDVHVIAQLLEDESRNVAALRGANDFIVTDALASRMLVHVSRASELAGVFQTLFDPEGPVITVRSILDEVATFGALAAAVARDGQVAIGVRTGGAVHINPPVDRGMRFAEGDVVLVVAPAAAAAPLS